MKLAQLTNPHFLAALQKLQAQPVGLKAAFKLKGILASVQENLIKFEEVRQGALQKYGNKDADGKLALEENSSVKFSGDNLELFAKELSDLGAVDVEVTTISLGELGDIKLSAEEVTLLDGLLVE
jgi:hypothetical protein